MPMICIWRISRGGVVAESLSTPVVIQKRKDGLLSRMTGMPERRQKTARMQAATKADVLGWQRMAHIA